MENLENNEVFTDDGNIDNQIDTKERKKKKHRRYRLSINHKELKELEGTTANSFLALAESVILIDGTPYNKKYIALSNGRKSDFKRFIEHYSIIELTGKRKYFIKRVYSKEEKKELQELEINSLKVKK